MEASDGPLGQVALEGEVHRGGLVFLRSTRVGCISTRRKLPEERDEGWHEGAGAGGEGKEGEPGPPGG